jgi:N-formylglutamate deformylase
MPTQTVPGVLFARLPDAGDLPLVFDSPHSGLAYPPDFQPAAPEAMILTSCDRFPRAYIDPNRSAGDLDPDLLAEPWPGQVDGSDYTRRGMGLIRRFALPGVPLYRRKLTLAEVEARLAGYYRPYRDRLAGIIEAAVARHGAVWHCNCHSMKSVGNAMNTDAGSARPDFVLSDRWGRTSDQRFTRWVATRLTLLGYTVKINDPYQGGDLVATFGHPDEGRNSLQIEVNRALYLNEATYEKHAGFARLEQSLAALQEALAEYVRGQLAARPG